VALFTGWQTDFARGLGSVVFLSAFEFSLVVLTVGLVVGALAQSSQRRADGWLDYCGPSPLILCGSLIAMSLAATLGVGVVVEVLGLTIATSVAELLTLLVNVVCYLVLVQVAVVRSHALTWRDMARPGRLAPDPSDLPAALGWSGYQPAGTTRSPARALAADVGLGLGLAFPFMIGTLILSALLAVILGIQDSSLSSPVPTILSDWDFWIILLAVAVVAPFGEEIFFRGFATNAWGRSLERNQALLRAAVMFACIHLINIIGGSAFDDLGLFLKVAFLTVVARLPVAWALSWVYTRRRSIFASFALHSGYNGGLVVLVWWLGQLVR
jgi:membrane protease YdiL (CAAX protease family)